jgi:FkbM family methyltransferase
MRLDDCASELGLTQVSVAKVDIEGHEDPFLAGARDLITRDQPVIICEINK